MQCCAPVARPCGLVGRVAQRHGCGPVPSVARRGVACRAACVPVNGSEDTVAQLHALQLQTAAPPADHPDSLTDQPPPTARVKPGPGGTSPPLTPTFAVGDIVMGEVTYCGPWGAKVKLLQQPDVVGHVMRTDGPLVQSSPGDLLRVHPDHTCAFTQGLIRAFKVTSIPQPLHRNSKRQVQLSGSEVDTSLAWQRLQQAAQLSFDTQQPLTVTVRAVHPGYVRCSAMGIAAIIPRSQLVEEEGAAPQQAAGDETTESAMPTTSSSMAEATTSSTTTTTSSSSGSVQTMQVMVLELNQQSRRAVLSQRRALEVAAQQQQQQRTAGGPGMQQQQQQQLSSRVGELVTGTVEVEGPAFVRVTLDGCGTSAVLPVDLISCYQLYDARNVFAKGDKVVALVAGVGGTPSAPTAADDSTSHTMPPQQQQQQGGANSWSWRPSAAAAELAAEGTADASASTAAAVSMPATTTAAATVGLGGDDGAPAPHLCYAAAPPVQWSLSAARAAVRQAQHHLYHYHHQQQASAPQQQQQSAASAGRASSSQSVQHRGKLILSTAHLELEAGDMLYRREEVYAAALERYGLTYSTQGLAASDTTAAAAAVGVEEQEWLAPDHQQWQADEQQQWAAEQALTHGQFAAEAAPVAAATAAEQYEFAAAGNGVVTSPAAAPGGTEEQEWLAPDHQQWQADEQEQWAAEQALTKGQPSGQPVLPVVQPAAPVEVPVLPVQEEQAWCAPGQQPWQEEEWATAGGAASAWQPA